MFSFHAFLLTAGYPLWNRPPKISEGIEAAGFAIRPQRLIEEHISGSVAASERVGFIRLLYRMENGDVLIVTKLDRLGRNAMDIRKTVEQLAGADIRVHCLALGGIYLTSAVERMTMQVISAVAEFERELLLDRTHSGIGEGQSSREALWPSFRTE